MPYSHSLGTFQKVSGCLQQIHYLTQVVRGHSRCRGGRADALVGSQVDGTFPCVRIAINSTMGTSILATVGTCPPSRIRATPPVMTIPITTDRVVVPSGTLCSYLRHRRSTCEGDLDLRPLCLRVFNFGCLYLAQISH